VENFSRLPKSGEKLEERSRPLFKRYRQARGASAVDGAAPFRRGAEKLAANLALRREEHEASAERNGDSNQYGRCANVTRERGGGGPRAPLRSGTVQPALSVGRTLASEARQVPHPPALQRAPREARRGSAHPGRRSSVSGGKMAAVIRNK